MFLSTLLADTAEQSGVLYGGVHMGADHLVESMETF